jgi:hypothetical protein
MPRVLSARSSPANIAEGFGRFGNKEFARFVRIARGSQEEVLNHFIDARDQLMLTEDELMIEEHHVRGACGHGRIDPTFGVDAGSPAPTEEPRTTRNLNRNLNLNRTPEPRNPGTPEPITRRSSFQEIGFYGVT